MLVAGSLHLLRNQLRNEVQVQSGYAGGEEGDVHQGVWWMQVNTEGWLDVILVKFRQSQSIRQSVQAMESGAKWRYVLMHGGSLTPVLRADHTGLHAQ